MAAWRVGEFPGAASLLAEVDSARARVLPQGHTSPPRPPRHPPTHALPGCLCRRANNARPLFLSFALSPVAPSPPGLRASLGAGFWQSGCCASCATGGSSLATSAPSTSLVGRPAASRRARPAECPPPLAANLVLQDTIERIYVGQKYGDIERGIFLIRGENLMLLGEIVRALLCGHCLRRRGCVLTAACRTKTRRVPTA
jgi:hypothetical protein